MRLLVVTCLYILSCLAASGQQLYLQSYPKEQYQGSDQSWAFAQDKKGILYVANNDGILQFNGQKWELLSIPGQHYALYLAFDSRERLFVGSFNDFGYFQRDGSGKFQYHSLMGLLPDSLKSVRNISQVGVYEDTVFFKGPDHIYIYAGGTIRILDGSGYLLRFQKRIYFLDKGGLHPYNNLEFLPPWSLEELHGSAITRIKEYISNTALILDDKNRLWLFDPDAAPGNQLHPFPKKLDNTLQGSRILTLLYLDDGHLAVLLEKGLFIVDREGSPVNFIPNTALGTDITYSRLFLDNHHNLWLTTTTNPHLFQIITSSPLSYFDRYNGIDASILSFGKSGRFRYVGTSKGILYQDSNRAFHPIPHVEHETWQFHNFSGKLYAAQETGVFEMDGPTARKLIDQASVNCLCELNNQPDRFLMGTYSDGILLMEKKANAWTKHRVKGFDEETKFIQQDKEGNIWAGNPTIGIFRLRFNTKLDSVISKLHYDTAKGLPATTNNRLFRLKNGDLLALTSNGVYEYDKEKDRFSPARQFRQALPEGWSISSVAETPDGDIYFRGGSGRYKEMAGVLHRQPDGSFSFLQTPFYKIAISVNPQRVEDELPLLVAGPEEIWLGTGEKLVTYDPSKKTWFDDSLSLFINQVHTGDSLIFNSGTTDTALLSIPYSRDELQFTFYTPWFEDPEKVEYQYKLEGFDNKWSSWSQDNEASFTNLPEGDYVLWARARNVYGKTGSALALPFRIRPPWYHTWLAYTLYLLGLLLIVFTIIKLYTKSIAAKNRALEKKVAEKTREITDNAKKLKELNDTKDRLFSIVSHDLRGPISTMKAVVDIMKNSTMSEQDVRTFGVELGDHLLVTGHLLNNLLSWSRSQMDGVRSNREWLVLQEIAEENCRLFMSVATSRNIHLRNQIHTGWKVLADRDVITTVLRNLLSNAIKFTHNGGEVIIGAEKHQSKMEVFVKDTGSGISQEGISRIIQKQSFHKPDASGQIGAGLGLLLCQEMIEKDGGSIAITSTISKGSRFSILIPDANA